MRKKIFLLVLFIILISSLVMNLVLVISLANSRNAQIKLEDDLKASTFNASKYDQLRAYLELINRKDIYNVALGIELPATEVYVFFKPDSLEEAIRKCIQDFSKFDGSRFVNYTSSTQAKEEYISYNPSQADIVANIDLPASALFRSERVDDFIKYVEAKSNTCSVEQVKANKGNN